MTDRPVITFHETPYRHYQINPDQTGHKHPWTPEEPWGRVASVTQILGTLDKSGPLVGWATNITCESAWRMVVENAAPDITDPIVEGLRKEAANEAEKKNPRDWLIRHLNGRANSIEARGYSMPRKWRQFQHEMRLAGLDHNSATKDAQLRGSTVHKIGEDWVTEGRFPNLADYPVEWRGYVRAIARFLAEHGEGLRVAEEIVGSVRHGFAGTCDTVAVATFGDSTVRIDYKTARNVYARTHFRQLGAYEGAAVEMGDEPTDRQAIVILGADGEWSIHYTDEVEWRTSPYESFLDVLRVWRDEQPLKKHEEAAYRARKGREAVSK